MKRIVVLTIALTMLFVGAQSALAYDKGLQFAFGGLDNLDVTPIQNGTIGFLKAHGDDYLIARFGLGLESMTAKSNVDGVSDYKESDMMLRLGLGIQKPLGPEEYQLQPYVILLGELLYETEKDEPSVADNPADGTTLENKATTMGFGASAGIGGEYFFKPTISLSAEYTFGLMYASTKSETTVQGVETDDIEGSGFDFGPFNAAGVTLTLYWN